jgi:isochorismate synthase
LPSAAEAAVVSSKTRPIDRTDAQRLLKEARGQARVAFNGTGEAWVAIGSLWVVAARGRERFAVARRHVQALLSGARVEGPEGFGPRMVGGASLLPDHQAEGLWAGFDSVRLWLPERQIHWVEGQAYETLNEVAGKAPELARLHDVPPKAGSDSRTLWTGRAARVMRSMQRLEIHKAVLARTARLPPGDADELYWRLVSREPHTMRFLVDPDGHGALVGATPELLVSLKRGALRTHALAGTVARAGEASADAAAAQGLLTSKKDEQEHELVRQHLAIRLTSLGATAVQTGSRRLRGLRTVLHIETPMAATLPETTHVLDAIAALHPTPAVAGHPVERSLKLLEHIEPVPRGWYTGIVGWCDAKGNGAFHVALRCALLREDSTWLYAGAGLMPQSQPSTEWQETEDKLAAIRDALEAA